MFAGLRKSGARCLASTSAFSRRSGRHAFTVFEALRGKALVAPTRMAWRRATHERDASSSRSVTQGGLADGLIRVIDEPQTRERIGAAARETGKQYDITAFVRKMERLYEILHRVSRATHRKGVLVSDLSFLTSNAPV